MTTYSISAIRTALANAVATITGVRAVAYIADQVTPPAGGIFAIVRPGEPLADYDMTMGRGCDALNFVITIFTEYVNERTASDVLDSFLAGSGSTSIKTAIESDTTLGGIVSYAKVRRAGNYGLEKFGEIDYLSIEFYVEVLTSP